MSAYHIFEGILSPLSELPSLESRIIGFFEFKFISNEIDLENAFFARSANFRLSFEFRSLIWHFPAKVTACALSDFYGSFTIFRRQWSVKYQIVMCTLLKLPECYSGTWLKLIKSL